METPFSVTLLRSYVLKCDFVIRKGTIIEVEKVVKCLGNEDQYLYRHENCNCGDYHSVFSKQTKLVHPLMCLAELCEG